MIKIPNNLFKPKNVVGKLGKVFIYALDANTIGITNDFALDWAKIALYRKTWTVQREGSNWIVKLPTRVLRFYLVTDPNYKSKMVSGVNGGRILITVTRELR